MYVSTLQLSSEVGIICDTKAFACIQKYIFKTVCVCVCAQVVQKKEAHDYRCLFRVCFMPKNLKMLLQEDPTAFEYLYLQVDRWTSDPQINSRLQQLSLNNTNLFSYLLEFIGFPSYP